MKHLHWILVIFFACNQRSNSSTETIRRGDTIIKGDIINDSLFNDTMLYYVDSELVASRVFKNGKEDGISVDYHDNKKPRKITSFSNGLKSGVNTYYDSSGVAIYSDFYYYDLTVGPILYYNKSGDPKRYFFSNLQDETILHVNYENWTGIASIVESCIKYSVNTIKYDTLKKLRVFIYLMEPPKLSFKYSICKRKVGSSEDMIALENITSNLPFTSIELPVLTTGEQYLIKLQVYDSILKRKSVIYKDLDYE